MAELHSMAEINGGDELIYDTWDDLSSKEILVQKPKKLKDPIFDKFLKISFPGPKFVLGIPYFISRLKQNQLRSILGGGFNPFEKY